MLTKYAIRIETFIKFSTLLKELVVRDIKVRYRKSMLGILWTLLNPILTMLIMTLVFSAFFKSGVPNFHLYVLIGHIVFSFNADATNQSLTSIIGNASLIKKVYIPKYLFPLAKTMSCLVNLGFAMVSLVLVMLFTGVRIHVLMLGIFVPLIYLLMFSLGLGLLLAAVNVFFRDIGHLYSVFTTLWMYLTPIFYAVDILPPEVQGIIKLNPLYYYLSFIRQIILDKTFPGLQENLICMFISITALIIGVIVFKKKQDKFILHI